MYRVSAETAARASSGARGVRARLLFAARRCAKPRPVNAPDSAARPAAPPLAAAGDAHWYKDAVIYQLHVKAFFDSDGDGRGDFRGLTEKLDYIRELGVNTLWLLPFYPSPLRDDGFDVADYGAVHPHYGTEQDFRRFVEQAHARNLRVITELVLNHTSDQHPWFQAARRAPKGSPERDMYVWSDDERKYAGTRVIFSDTESSNWAWDKEAGQYYWHRFFSHQPDLNFDNPRVREAVLQVMMHWCALGVDGFRLDAIPYLVEREGTANENLPETHALIKAIRAALDARHPGKLLLAEANQWPEDVREYFGEADECHMAYHFPLMPRMYMAIAQEDRHPIVEILQQTPEIPDGCQWAIFLRNHDELTLEMVTSRERDYMYRVYAADARARLNLGIRRRLAPLLENDVDRIKLMNSLLLSMPGSPIIYYGDEIGMGDNIYLGDRDGVRTPMHWSPDRNAGFSRADPQRLYLPPIMDPVYGYEAVNVEAQTREPGSLLNWMRRLLAVRNTSRAFGRGRLSFLRAGNRKVLAYVRELGEEAILCVANLGRSAQPVELDLRRFKGRVPVEMLGRTAFPPVGELPYLLTLPGCGFYWFRLATDAPAPAWHADAMAREDLPVLVLFDGWTSFFRDRVVPWRINMAVKTREHFETQVLPAWLGVQRWYAAKGDPAARVRLGDWALWDAGRASFMLALLEVESGGESAQYFAPLALAWEERDEERVKALGSAAVAKVRQQASVGLLADALADEAFCRAVVVAIGEGREVKSAGGTLRFTPTAAFAEIACEDVSLLPVARPKAQSSNTVVTLGERLFLKGYRRVRAGINPEFEVGRHLTERLRFAHCVPVAGAIEHTAADGTQRTLALLQAYVPNQGDAWTHTVDTLERFLEERRGTPPPPDPHAVYLALVHTLGLRTGELHRALLTRTGAPAFDPEPAGARDLEQWKAAVRADAAATLELLAQRRGQMAAPARDDAAALIDARRALQARIDQVRLPAGATLKARHHGDYHLGQVLLSKLDVVITDFEGEPARGLAERRAKHSPLRDVASMLRSFSYARWTALRLALEGHADYERLAPHAADWEARARRAFLGAYDEAMRAGGLYASFDDLRELLDLFELEKALYELRYELNNRPGWVGIPLAGILALLD
jgi:maltose alpha-D-glucosyltransferase/alpha-amylase